MDGMAVGLLLVWLTVAMVWSRRSGIGHLLWFCEIDMLVLVIGIFSQSRILVSAQIAALAFFHLGWNVDFWITLFRGSALLGFTDYMFFPGGSLCEKSLSFFTHVFVVPAGMAALLALGVHRKAWILQAFQTIVVLLMARLLTNPYENINWAFRGRLPGFSGAALPSGVYLGLVAGILVVFYRIDNLLLEWLERGWRQRLRAPACSFRFLSVYLMGLGLLSIVVSVSAAVAADRRFLPAEVSTGMGDHDLPAALSAGAEGSTIERVFFGEKKQREVLPLLWRSARLPENWRRDIQVHTKALLSEVDASDIPPVPQEIVITGRRLVPGSTVWAVVASDRFYIQSLPDLFGERDRYQVRCFIGGRGVSEYLDASSGTPLAPTTYNEILGGGTGAIYALAVAEVLDGKAVAKSPFYLVKRRGIRLPEDIWYLRHGGRLEPLLSAPTASARSRVAFQSPSEDGDGSYDVYTADFFGYDVRELTGCLSDHAGFMDLSGAQAQGVGWVTDTTLRILIQSQDGKRLVETTDREPATCPGIL